MKIYTYFNNICVIKNNCDITKDNGFALKNLHCDFERTKSNITIMVFPDINIRFYIWHYKRSLEYHKNKIFYNEVNHNRVNNASESFNNYLSDLFSKKTYFRLIYTLNIDVSLYSDTYERRKCHIAGL
ncbi:hypothetical protein U3516DRAFT_739787 [Neocallimastix sp. 'constans']